MFYTYILKSQIVRKFYTGHCDNINKRLGDHNSGKAKYTRRYKPWEVVYREEFPNENDAIRREKYFKSAAGRKWLKKYVNK